MNADFTFLPDNVTAGFSGGADSTALMRLLIDLRESKRKSGVKFTLSAVHVNHGLRGEESDRDEEFVKSFCDKFSVPLACYRLTLTPNASEEEARLARYDCFKKAAEHFGTTGIVVAHHRDDQTETLLMHLLRGSGLTGLSGMRRVQQDEKRGITLYRPLLDCSREELRKYLMGIGQTWREDGSNRDNTYLRNTVRNNLIPLLEEIRPGSSSRIAEAAENLSSDEDTLEYIAEEKLQQMSVKNPSPAEKAPVLLPIAALMKECGGMQKRILRLWWNNEAGKFFAERNLSRQKTQELNSLVYQGAGKSCNMPGSMKVVRGWKYLHLITDSPEKITAEIPFNGGKIVTGNITLRCAVAAPSVGDGKTTQAVKADFLSGTTIRTRRTGDYIRPFGSKGKKSLQDYFTDNHVDSPLRDYIPLIARENEILMVCGVGCGSIPEFNAGDKNVFLMWEGNIPWK